MVVEEIPETKMGNVRQRVLRGAKWLDENVAGDWTTRINLETLSLKRAHRCICGQLFEDTAATANGDSLAWYIRDGFHWALKSLFEEANSWLTALVPMGLTPLIRRNQVSRSLGFTIGATYTTSGERQAWAYLEKEWRKLIEERRTARG